MSRRPCHAGYKLTAQPQLTRGPCTFAAAGLNVEKSSLLTLIPYIAMTVMTPLVGPVADGLVERGWSVTAVRKLSQVGCAASASVRWWGELGPLGGMASRSVRHCRQCGLGSTLPTPAQPHPSTLRPAHVQGIAFAGPALCMVALAVLTPATAGAGPTGLIVGIMSLAFALGAWARAGLYCNHQDLSPKYAAALLGERPSWAGWMVIHGIGKGKGTRACRWCCWVA